MVSTGLLPMGQAPDDILSRLTADDHLLDERDDTSGFRY
jgi:hypothetical protein